MTKNEKQLLKQMVDAVNHRDIRNPDDTGNLSSQSFLQATDPKTRQQLGEIESFIQNTCVDSAGFAIKRSITEARSADVDIQFIEAQDPADGDETVICVNFTHGSYAIPVQHEAYR